MIGRRAFLALAGIVGLSGCSAPGESGNKQQRPADTDDTMTDRSPEFYDESNEELTADVNNQSVRTGEIGLTGQIIYLYAKTGDLLTTIDPANTTTPIQDSISYLSSNGGGTISLPPAKIEDPGPLNWASNVNMVGHGIGGDQSIVKITDSANDGLVFGTGGLNSVYLDGFNLLGPGDGSSTGIPYHVTARCYDVFFGRVKFQGWSNTAIKWDTDLNLSNLHHQFIRTVSVDAGDKPALVNLQSGGPNNKFGSLNLGATSTRTASDSQGLLAESGGSLVIGQVNLGGSIGLGADLKAVRNVDIGSFHYEPNNQQSSHSRGLLMRFNPNHNVHTSRFAAGTLDYLVSVEGAAKFVGPISAGGSITLNNTRVEITSDPARESIMLCVPSSFVDNTTGSTLTNGVACLGDLTLKTSTGTGA